MLLSNLVYALVNSAALAVMAIGFTLTFGISGVANFAYGSYYVLAAYCTWFLFHMLSLPYPLAAIVSILFMAMLGGFSYRFILLRIHGQVISEVIATFAMGLLIMELLVFFAGGYGRELPVFWDHSVQLGTAYIDVHRIMIIALCAILVAGLWVFTHHTRTGLAFRGIAQEERTSLTLGINSDWIGTLSVSMGAALAGVAAVAIFPLETVTTIAGYGVMINALAVCIIGGMGSTTGLVLASLLMGFAQKASDIYIGSNYRMVVSMAAILLILFFKPSGLLGKQKELEERI
ncbi:MAG: branched-chain amino acid ABC transporter permease [Desulfobacteraceae bacterium]|nr:MAG: branched-chain amino acid ABC transporter permease [Desulfobacteraceae bacterium]